MSSQPKNATSIDMELVAQGVAIGLGDEETLAKLKPEVLAQKIQAKVESVNDAEVEAEEKAEAKAKLEKEKEVLEKKNVKAKKAEAFDESVFLDKMNPTRSPNKMSHLVKCKFRACSFFNVSLDHLTKAYKALSGRKIDGVFINDMIDRYGFSNGRQTNLADLASKNSKNNFSIEIAIDKLKAIIVYENVLGAYGAYMNDVQVEIEKGIKESYVFGE